MKALRINKIIVFSTYVEMILNLVNYAVSYASVLHVCGDDPKGCLLPVIHFKCSPRMWR